MPVPRHIVQSSPLNDAATLSIVLSGLSRRHQYSMRLRHMGSLAQSTLPQVCRPALSILPAVQVHSLGPSSYLDIQRESVLDGLLVSLAHQALWSC